MLTPLLSWFHDWPTWLYWSVVTPWLTLGLVLAVLWVVMAFGAMLGKGGQMTYSTQLDREKVGFGRWLVRVVVSSLVNFVAPAADVMFLMAFGGLLLAIPDPIHEEFTHWTLGNSLHWAALTTLLLLYIGTVRLMILGFNAYLSWEVEKATGRERAGQ